MLQTPPRLAPRSSMWWRRGLQGDRRRCRARRIAASLVGSQLTEDLGIIKLGPELFRLCVVVVWILAVVVAVITAQRRTHDMRTRPPICYTPLLRFNFTANAAAPAGTQGVVSRGEMIRSWALCHRTDHCTLPKAAETIATTAAEATPVPPRPTAAVLRPVEARRPQEHGRGGGGGVAVSVVIHRIVAIPVYFRRTRSAARF